MFKDALEISDLKRALSRVWRRRLCFSNALGQAHRGGVMSNTEEHACRMEERPSTTAVRTVTRADLVGDGLSAGRAVALRIRRTGAEFLDEICDAAARGETVKLSSFGSFVVRSKSQRIGRNPKTGVEVPILPRRVMVFKPSNVLKARINGVAARRREIRGQGAGRRETEMDKSPDAFRTISEVAEDLDSAAACAAVLGNAVPADQAAEARRRPAILSPRGRRAAARDQAPALRRGLHDQGRAEAAERAGRPPV